MAWLTSGLGEHQSSLLLRLWFRSTLPRQQHDVLPGPELVWLHAQDSLAIEGGLEVLVLPGGGGVAPSHLAVQAWSAHPAAFAHKAWLLHPGAAHASQGHHPVLLEELGGLSQHPQGRVLQGSQV